MSLPPVMFNKYELASHPFTARSYRSTLYTLPSTQIQIYYHGTRCFINDTVKKQIKIFTGHKLPIQALAVHPTGGLVATADIRGNLKIWSPTHETLLVDQEYECDGQVSVMQFNPEGKKLLIGCTSGKNSLLVCDTEMKTISPMPAASQVNCVALKQQRPYASISCSSDGQICAFTYNFKPACSAKLNIFPCSSSYSPDGAFALVGGLSGCIHVLDKELKEIQRTQAHRGPVYAMQSLDGKLYTAGADASFKVWTVTATGEMTLEKQGVFAGFEKDPNFNMTGFMLEKDSAVLILLNSYMVRVRYASLTDEGFDLNTLEKEIGFNGPVRKLAVVGEKLYGFQDQNAFIVNEKQQLPNAPLNRPLLIDQFGGKTYVITATELHEIIEGQVKQVRDLGMTAYAVFKYSEDCVIIQLHKTMVIYNLEKGETEKTVFTVPEKYEEIVMSDFQAGNLAVGLKNKTSTKKNSIILLKEAENYVWNNHSSEYFVSIVFLKVQGERLLAGGSEGRLCCFNLADFEKDEEDIWPWNAQMDYSKSAIARPRAGLIRGDMAYVAGDLGVLEWDLTVTKAVKKWRKLSESCQIDTLVEYNGMLWAAGEDGVLRTFAFE